MIRWFERLETLAGLETRSAFWYVGFTFDEMEAGIVELNKRVSALEAREQMRKEQWASERFLERPEEKKEE